VHDEPLNPRVAERLTRAARAAQALSEALWEGLHEELNDPRSARVTQLSERLADVSLAVASLARANDRADDPRTAGQEPEQEPAAPARMSSPTGVPAESDHPVAVVIHDGSPGAPIREAPAVQERPSVAILVDELAPEGSSAPSESPPGSTVREPSAQRESSRSLVQVPPEIEIRDERGEREQGQSAWIAAIARRLERYERDGAPFAVLLVELVDVERLRHAELPGEMARLTGLIETALAGELRPPDSLTRESPGRYWLLAGETDSSGAQTLAEQLSEAVRRAVSHRGTPLQVAIGVAVCPADGSQAAALAAQAAVALYAARAAGRPVA
jgi:GGDEF domain-containing protein